MTLHVPSFGGGVVLLGSPDMQKPDELGLADSYEIGPRGQLVCTSDATAYTTVKDKAGTPAPLSEVYGIGEMVQDNVPYAVVIGKGDNAGASYLTARIQRTGEPATLAAANVAGMSGPGAPPAAGTIVTMVQMPGSFNVFSLGARKQVLVACLGAREGAYPNTAAGLVAGNLTAGFAPGMNTTGRDMLGTGPLAEDVAGTKGKRLYFRGIVAYNNYVFGWGYDSADTTNYDGPNRVLFSNPGTPLKWGNDNQAATGTDRDYTDSDAIVLGDAGEIIRGALKWNGKLYFGTNSQLHYIAGYGRDSFLTDGANPVARSYNIIGPYALIEGPDRQMYGVADKGLWATSDGVNFVPLFEKLVDFAGHSTGYWDLIWNDPTLATGYPGKTNQDLVWMAADWERFQVLVGIPFCNATTGKGVGTDTVIIKYHTKTGGFTRQVFAGVAYTAAGYFRRLGQQREARFLATATSGAVTVQRYGYQATPTDSPALPTRLPDVSFGPYDPFGPDGEGVVRRCYLTLAWEAAASLPLVFTMTTTADASLVNSFTLTVSPSAPGSPVDGDVWLDTSQTDTSIGNGTAGTNIPATGGYLTKVYNGGAWAFLAGSGEMGTRGTIVLPLIRRVATRVTVTATCTSATGRYQIEGLGMEPGGGSPNA